MWKIAPVLTASALIAATASASEPVRYVKHEVRDRECNNRIAANTLAPAGWKIQDKLSWTFADPDVPFRYDGTYTSPDGRRVIKFYPDEIASYASGPGYSTGMQPPEGTIAAMKFCIRELRKNVNYTIVHAEAKPKQRSNSEAYGQTTTHTSETGRVRISYQQDGETVEEEFIATLHTMHMVSIGAVRLDSGFWRFTDLCSIRSPKSELAETRQVAQVILTASTPTLEFYNDLVQTKKILLEMGLERIRHVKRMSDIGRDAQQQISQTIVDSYWKTQARHETRMEQFSDYMRGVEPYRDGGRIVKVPSGYREVWSNGNGEYLLSDTTGYNPNRDLNGNWSRLQPGK